MKTLTYHPIEKNKYGSNGIQMRESGVPKGEYWPVLDHGKQAAVIQLDDVVVCMSVESRVGYYSPEQQLNTLVEGYLNDPEYRIKRMIAQGEVTIVKSVCSTRVYVGGLAIASVNTYPISSLCVMSDNEGSGGRYFIDLLHPFLFDPLLRKTGYVPLMAALLPAKSLLAYASVV